MNENVDIFICTHTKLPNEPKNEVYKIVAQTPIELKSDLPVYYVDEEKMGKWAKLPRGLSEFYNIFYVRHFIEKKEYVGFNHYRTFFIFFDHVPDFNALFKKYDVVCTGVAHKSLEWIFSKCIDLETYQIIKDTVREDFPELWPDFCKFLDQRWFFCKNLFVMKTEKFNEIIDTTFDYLEKFMDRIECHTDEELYQRAIRLLDEGKCKNMRDMYLANPPTLARFPAYAGEIMTAFFLWRDFEKQKVYRFIQTGRPEQVVYEGEINKLRKIK